MPRRWLSRPAPAPLAESRARESRPRWPDARRRTSTRAADLECLHFRGARRQRPGLPLDLSTRRLRSQPPVSSDDIDDLSPGDRQQPSFGIRRAAIQRPIRQRRGECLGERILGGGHIPRARRKKGDELAVAAARNRVRRAACLLVAFVSSSASRSSAIPPAYPRSAAPRPRHDPPRDSAPPTRSPHPDRARQS